MDDKKTAPRATPDAAQSPAGAGRPQPQGLRGPTARVGHLLRRAYQAALENSARGFADLDITPRQAAAVWEIHVRGRLSQRELGEAIGMDAPNVHGLVTRLLKRGVVARAKDRADPRRKLISLTGEGEAIAASLPERARVAEEATLSGLAPKDRAVLIRLLEQIAEVGDGEGSDEGPFNRSFT